MQRRALSACCLVALVVASTVAIAVPATASAPAQPSTASATETADSTTQVDRRFNGTAFLAVDEASDGDLVAGGFGIAANGSDSQPVLTDTTATLVRVGENGAAEWSTSIEGENATRVVDVLAADDGIYFLLVEDSPDSTGLQSVDLRLGKATSDGDVSWQRSLNTSLGLGFGLGAGGTLVDTDGGVALARQVPDGGVRLAEYSGGDVAWERTYDVDAGVRSVRATGDGFLLAGSVGFDEPWVLRTTESGRPTFNETYPGITSSGVLGAVPTDDGGVVLAGQHRSGLEGGLTAWTAGIDGDGEVRWTRVHGAGSDVQFNRVFDAENGLLLAGQNLVDPPGESGVRLVGVGADGARLFDEEVEDAPRITAMTKSGDRLRVAGLADLDPTTGELTGALAEIPVPAVDAEGNATLEADAGLASNGTFYRGQDLRVSTRGPTDTYDLVRLPGERESGPQVVRSVSLGDDDTAVIESATLPRGEYVLRTPYDRAAALEDGRVSGFADRREAAFRLESQDLFRVETNRTFVDAAAGQHGVSFTFDSERSNYDVHVRADRFRGDAAGADDLHAAFGGVDGFEGIDVVEGQPAARIEVGDDPRVRLNATVSAFDPGLYDVVVSAVDTRDGGAVADGRVVVGLPEERPVGLELANRSLGVAAGEEVATNVTLSSLTEGVGALALSANRTGEPGVRLRLRAEVDASRLSSGGSISQRESTTEMMAFDANTSTGAVEVARFRVRAESLGRDPITNGTNTATLRVDWVVDDDGVPYTLPDPVTVTYEVTDAGNATGDGGPGEERGTASGEGGAAGAAEGSASGAGGSA
ncbi:hypothetical protein [Salinirussus salinus]|uniref:hypothetical protein n=1 Tax=Salinirussus salinus TaxID=1198300 RepID=UPI0013567A96|nr:hypothetical protein [Salinirussus salinus]